MSRNPMANEAYLKEHRDGLRAAVAYFSSTNKAERELWVSRHFCQTLGLRFKASDHQRSLIEPPDVLFRDAKFEVKEILDKGRRRHGEYKTALQRALAAREPSELVEEFIPTNATPAQLARRIKEILRELTDHYAPAVRAQLDILFYVNLQANFFVGGRMPSQRQFARFGWRSVSAYENSASLVFFAAPNAPRFLRRRRGTFRIRLRQ